MAGHGSRRKPIHMPQGNAGAQPGV
ncbi:protein of unknown function (plasmid) [Azospirillum baldaniorum]|uniref:Uncharacterized protein n=1 Tax=Azospirillum baldaniorum TaxID=1064539 RepID=A0A9P1JXL5_9PROT|nr:protein of unknown function [Azospirillum baldaniorum]